MQDYSRAANAFSQLAGILAGFSVAISVVFITEIVSTSHPPDRDVPIALTLAASIAYVVSAGIFAGSTRWQGVGIELPYRVGLVVFLFANVLAASTILVICIQFGLIISSIVSGSMVIFAIAVLVVNLMALYRGSQLRQRA